jgi:hypothetical protein
MKLFFLGPVNSLLNYLRLPGLSRPASPPVI